MGKHLRPFPDSGIITRAAHCLPFRPETRTRSSGIVAEETKVREHGDIERVVEKVEWYCVSELFTLAIMDVE